MRTLLLAALLLTGCSEDAMCSPRTRINVSIIAGQSNARGLGTSPPFTDYPSVDFWPQYFTAYTPADFGTLSPRVWGAYSSPGQHGVELTMGRDVHLSGRQIAIVKGTQDGTGISPGWLSGGTQWSSLATTIASARTKLRVLHADEIFREHLVWIQGETDAVVEADALAYQTRLTTFLASYRTTYGALTKAYIVQMHPDMTRTYVATVRDAQAAVVAANPSLNRLIVPDAITGELQDEAGDFIHYTSAGLDALGSLIATAIQADV